jgi:hypothetical protein
MWYNALIVFFTIAYLLTEKGFTRMEKSTPYTKAIICDELIEYVAGYMARGYKKFALKRKIEEDLDTSMCIKTFETLRSKARQLLKDTLLSPEEHKINAIEIIYQTVQDDKVSASARLRAAELLLTTASEVSPEENEERESTIRKLLKEIDESIEGGEVDFEEI